jgi:hypothetical protein
MNGVDQRPHLFGGFIVAREQDDPAYGGMRQQFAVFRREFQTREIQHQWTERHVQPAFVTGIGIYRILTNLFRVGMIFIVSSSVVVPPPPVCNMG